MTKPGDVNEPEPAYVELQASSDVDIAGSLAAMRRAAQRARQVAEQTGTDLIVMRGGRVTRVRPQKESHSQAGAKPALPLDA